MQMQLNEVERYVWFMRFDMERDMKYYEKRSAFFEFMNSVALVVIFISSMNMIMENKIFNTVLDQLYAEVTAMGYVLIVIASGYVGKSKENAEKKMEILILYRKLLEVEPSIENMEKIKKIEVDYAEVKVRAPQRYKALMSTCHNEVVEMHERMKSHDEVKIEKIRVGIVKKIFKNIFTF